MAKLAATPLQVNLDNEMEARGLNPRSLALGAGLKETAVKAIMQGKSMNPRLDTLTALSQFLGLSIESLTAPPGLPPGVTRGPSPTHKITRRVRPDPRQLPLDLPPLIKEIDIRAGAGAGIDAHQLAEAFQGDYVVSADVVRGEWLLPPDYLTFEVRVDPRQARIIEVVGDSMSPTLDTGDRVMIDTADRRPSPGGIFALWDGLGVVIKRIEHIPNTDPATLRISSDNPRHATYDRTVDEVRIVGRARLKVARL